MAWHVLDDLVWDSVRLLDAHHPADDDRVRDWVARLYGFQQRHDGSVTYFRDIDVLLRRRFVYRFPLEQHPDHAQLRDYFESLTGFTTLRVLDEDAEDFDGYGTQLEDGYVDPPLLYCDAGTALWRRMVEAGRLSGPDAVAPRPVTLVDAVVAVAEAAEQAGDRMVVALWYTLGSDLLMDGSPTLEDLRADPAVRRLRQIVRRTDALAVPLPRGHRPTDAEVAAMDDPAGSWWYLDLTDAESPH